MHPSMHRSMHPSMHRVCLSLSHIYNTHTQTVRWVGTGRVGVWLHFVCVYLHICYYFHNPMQPDCSGKKRKKKSLEMFALKWLFNIKLCLMAFLTSKSPLFIPLEYGLSQMVCFRVFVLESRLTVPRQIIRKEKKIWPSSFLVLIH